MGATRATPQDRDAAAQITPRDIETAREFWAYWGTPLLNAMLDAEPEVIAEQTGRCGGGNQA